MFLLITYFLDQRPVRSAYNKQFIEVLLWNVMKER